MKKKIISTMLIMSLFVGVSGCGNASESGVVTDTINENTQSVLESQNTLESQEVKEEAMKETLNGLIKENLRCMYEIFILSMLPSQGEPLDEWKYQVSEEYFKDFAEFEAYVRSVYCKETADRYLYNFPCEGDPKYVNIDGKLYENRMYDGGKGYYVDWSSYTIDIDSLTDDKCEFTVNCTVEWPAEKPVVEPYPVKGTVILQDGKWVLTEMIS